jgi:hypothetical protein
MTTPGLCADESGLTEASRFADWKKGVLERNGINGLKMFNGYLSIADNPNTKLDKLGINDRNDGFTIITVHYVLYRDELRMGYCYVTSTEWDSPYNADLADEAINRTSHYPIAQPTDIA